MKGLAVGVWVLFGAVAFAQAQPERLTFEVASIKLNTSLNTNQSINRALGGQLNAESVPVSLLLTFAYRIRAYQMEGLPNWAGTERYDILAKPSAEEAAKEKDPESEASQDRLRLRIQALLADRFGLVLRKETREMPVFNLVVAKGGPKLKPAEDGRPQISFNSTRMVCKNIPMQRLVENALSARLGRQVIDKTGLTGNYDMTVEFAADSFAPGASTGDDPARPAFPTALQEQAGLRLESAKAPVMVLVIEKVERPSAN